jgi:hypothetical protein
MLADTQSELLTMARAIGVNERWLQYPGTPKEHFDIASSKRLLALRLGAVEVSRHFVARFLREKRAGKVAA